MKSRRGVLVALVALVAITVLSVALGIQRILVLSSDFDELVQGDLARERTPRRSAILRASARWRSRSKGRLRKSMP